MPEARLGLTLQDLERAAALVHEVVAPTPQYAWPKLAMRTGCETWVKHENHTRTGAFKVRGGLVYVDALRRDQPGVRGVVSATRGNHGQSIAFAAARAGLPARIYVPHGNSPDQNQSMAAFGATLILAGNDFDAARSAARRAAEEEGLHYVPSFHVRLVAGVASYALEFLRAVPPLDAVYVSIGMGSGICGMIAARDLLGLKTQIVGVCAESAPATYLSFASAAVVPTATAATFADGIATRTPDAQAVAEICRGAARVVTVSEDEIAEAMRCYYDDAHQVAEGAGAAPLAALLRERERMAGRRVGLVLSGGNIERARFLQVLQGTTPAPPAA
jgi:threonine dehydratase